MLSVLAGKSLIQALPDRRYAIHELLRQYGESHLHTSGAMLKAQAAHGTFFMGFLAQWEDDVKGRRQIAALREINDDFENIRKAWLWSLEHEQFDAIDRALECLVIVGELTDKLLETRTILQQSAASLAVRGLSLWDQIIVRLARLNTTLRNDANSELVEVILGRARERDAALEVTWCLWVLAEHEAVINGRDKQAQSLYEELITLCRTTGNNYFLAHGLTGVSWRYAVNGEVGRAVESLQEGIAIRRKIGDVKNLDFVTAQLSWLTFDRLQDPKSAEALLDEQISLQNQGGITSILPILFGLKAMMAFWRNDVDATLKLGNRGMEIARNDNYLGGRSMCQGALGLVESTSGDYNQAQIVCREVDSLGLANMTSFLSHWVLSLASYALGDESGSRRRLTTAMQIACRFQSPSFQGMCLLLVTVEVLWKRDPQKSVEYLAFCFSQPPHLTKWLHNWPLLDDLTAQLQDQLGIEAYTAAWLRGQTLDLSTEAANELTELEAINRRASSAQATT